MKRVMLMTMCLVLFAGFGIVKADWTVLASDDFNRADGDLGSSWTDLVGDWKVGGNEAYCSGGSKSITEYNSYQMFSSTSSGFEEKVSSKVREWAADSRWAGIAMHIQSSDTYYMIRMCFQSSPLNFQIQKLDNGSESTIASSSYSGSNYQSYGPFTIEAVTDNAGNISATLYNHNGDELLTISGVDSSPLVNGYAGLWAESGTGYQKWDNFEISNNVPEPATIGLLTLGLGFLVRRK